MNYLVILFILPIIGLFIWVEHLTSKYERKIKNLKHLVYEIDNKLKELEEEQKN